MREVGILEATKNGGDGQRQVRYVNADVSPVATMAVMVSRS